MHVYLVKKTCRITHKLHIAMFTRIKDANEFAGGSNEGAYVWYQECGLGTAGWLILKWNGFEIDHGPIVSAFKLPDGTTSGFVHNKILEPWTLIDGAEWRSNQKIPKWLYGRVNK